MVRKALKAAKCQLVIAGDVRDLAVSPSIGTISLNVQNWTGQGNLVQKVEEIYRLSLN
jgi:hypothetical protein